MTYREYLEQCTDEFEKTVIIINLARKCPYYDCLGKRAKKKELNKLLDQEIEDTEREV